MANSAESSLPDRYRVEEQIAAGGMGRVVRASDRDTGTMVAIKLLREGREGGTSVDRFRREAQTLAELRHPGIVAHLGHGYTRDGEFYLVMEWIEGEDLRARLERGPLSEAELLTLLREVAAALAVAHRRGIIHRDLKPSNLLLRDGRVDQVVLIDFGIARHREEMSPMTQTGALLGTPEYMAPEQARGIRELPSSTDIFALGAIAYHCLVGQSPFAGDQVATVVAKILFDEIMDVREARPEVSDRLAALIARMLDRDPSARPSDADELYGELLTLGAGTEDEIPTLAPVEAPRPALEQRLLSVLIARPSTLDGEGDGDGDGDGDEDDQLTHTGSRMISDPLGIAVRLGGQPARLNDGALVVAFCSGDSATDRATVAARCALALRQGWPSMSLVLTTGRGRVQSGPPQGPVIDEARALAREQCPGVVVIDQLTSDLLDGRFDIVDRDGRRQLVRESPHQRDPRHLLGKPIPCLGRAHELGLLELTLESCVADGRSHFMLVSGPAGCGKSRLRHEFLRRRAGADAGLTVIHAEGDPTTAGAPYAIVGRGFRRAAGFEASDDDDARRLKLDALIERWLADRDSSTTRDFLAEIVGLPQPSQPCPAFRAALADPALMRDQCVLTCVELLRGALARQAVVWVIEDMHWGDQSSVDLMIRAHAELAEQPLMIVCVTRPDVLERFTALAEIDREPSGQHLRLGGLSRRAARRLVALALTGVVEPSSTLVDRIIEHAAGNALYLEELIRAAAAHGVDGFPSTVEAMIQARVEKLDDVARHALLAASVYGQSFTAADLAPMLDDVRPAALREALERLIGAEMLEALDDGYRFAHALLRDAAYHLLSPEGARRAHRLAAEQLMRLGNGETMRIAEHLDRAGLTEPAARYYLQAAQQASTVNAVAETLRRAELGLGCDPNPELSSQLNAIAIWANMFLGRWDVVVSLAEQTVPLLPVGSPWWCRCVSQVTAIHLFRANERQLERWVNLFLAAELDAENLEPYLDAVFVGIGTTTAVGRYRLSDRYARRAAELGPLIELHEDAQRLQAFNDAIVGFYVNLDLAASLAAAETTVRIARTIGVRRYAMFGQLCASSCHERLGRRELAIETARAALAEVEPVQNPYLTTKTSVALADALVTNGDEAALDEAEQLSAQIIANSKIPAPYPGWSRVIRARIRLRRGAAAAAIDDARAGLRLLTGAPSLQCKAWLVLADAEQALGHGDEACDAVEAALGVIEREGGWEHVDALAACVRLFRANDELDQAAQMAGELREQLAAISSRLPEAMGAEFMATFDEDEERSCVHTD